MTKKTAVIICAALFAVAVIDGGFKFFAIHHFAPDTSPMAWPIAGALHKNPGIIFDIPLPLEIIIPCTVVVCIALLALAYQRRARAPQESLALWAVVCGAAGNAVDRAVNGFTTDYIIFFQRSAVNIADILIIAGAIFYLYYSSNRPHEDTR